MKVMNDHHQGRKEGKELREGINSRGVILCNLSLSLEGYELEGNQGVVNSSTFLSL